jgi:mono/diheme cytochrome c family protein
MKTIKKAPFSFAVTFALMTGAICLVGCTKVSQAEMHKEPNVELIQDMMEQNALKAQDFEPANRDQASSLLPPEGTVPVGFKPYPYHLDAAAAAKNLKNPYSGNMSPEILTVGRTKFETYCAVCHGYEGKGDGPVSPKMALKPPPLISDKITALVDGGIFHIISDGQGVMSSYAQQLVNENDRWAIVNYVRSLQKLSKGGAGAGTAAGSASSGAVAPKTK